MAKSFGPYSVIRITPDFIFVSGQVGISNDGTPVAPDITSQTDTVLKNLEYIVESEGMSMDDVVKTTVFITDMDNFSAMNEEYVKHFPNMKPARSCVAVKELPRVGGDAPILVEIEAVVSKGSK